MAASEADFVTKVVHAPYLESAKRTVDYDHVSKRVLLYGIEESNKSNEVKQAILHELGSMHGTLLHVR